MHVKICGMTRLEDAVLAARAGADFVGLIRAPSPRQVSLDLARTIAREVLSLTDATGPAETAARTQPVLLYRDAPLSQMCDELQAAGIDWVQLHGHEPVSLVEDLLRRRSNLHVIKAWEVPAVSVSADAGARPSEGAEKTAPRGDALDLANYLDESAACGIRFDAVILDVPKSGHHPGFKRLGELSRVCQGRAREIWCAGGLSADNLARALRAGSYRGVDVSRGVESKPGEKDADLVRRFIECARAHASSP